MNCFTIRFKVCICFIMLLVVFSTEALAQPAVLSGWVTNSATGSGITGAKITVLNQVTYSVVGGFYSLNVSPSQSSAVCSKAGFDNVSSPVISFLAGDSVVSNFQLTGSPVPVNGVAATIDTSAGMPHTTITWQVPSGPSELIYDDGIEDDFTIWGLQGNMNAVRFTPPGYPARITGGKINTGSPSDYPVNSYPFVPFQVAVYAASGPGGTPGTLLVGPFDVFFTTLGWVEFNVPNPPVIGSGDFYLVMIQGGNAPNAAGLAIDNTMFQFRSYLRFVSGASQWIPASGNFMMRARVESPGGPMILFNNPAAVNGYTVFRLKQGEELNPAVWVSVGNTTANAFVDPSWPLLPCGPYRWGIQAHYPGNLNSPATFSNIIGKCWTTKVTIGLSLSCSGMNPSGSYITLKNLVYPDTLYSGIADTAGHIMFSHVWKGTYELHGTRFGYQLSSQNISISTDTVFSITLLQEKIPPGNLHVNDSSLVAVWNRPNTTKELFRENWDGGSFSTNSWVIQGGTNWQISTVTGSPRPSAMFGSEPQVSNYEQTLTSQLITGQNSPSLKLKFDIFLDNFGTTTLNQMAVELWDGTSWHTLQHFDNSQGSFPWETRASDISAWSGQTFKIRFRAYGGDSNDINNWNIDNIVIQASDNSPASMTCLLGYNFFLDNVTCGFLTDTTYTIPAALVNYGTTYNACVSAVYGSGSSVSSCYPFSSHYLVPPANLQGVQAGDKPYLSWSKPVLTFAKGPFANTPPGLLGYYIYRDGLKIDSIASPDTLNYLGASLFPGTYAFGVSARYDLSYYGQPGNYAESIASGPVNVVILYGFTLPFTETWNTLSFQSNAWEFDPDPGNWIISSTEGNPSPDAEFLPTPPQVHYSYSLESQILLAQSITCARVWFDFDLRHADQNLTSAEHLAAEVFFNNSWHPVGDFVNNGNIPWTSYHYEISPVKGDYFKIRFRAFGENSADILKWDVDNIHVYAVCNPPADLAGDAAGYDVHLTWSPPDCLDGNLMNEGFEETTFPPVNWIEHTTNPLATWFHASESSPLGVHTGLWAAGLPWDYSHQDEWLIAKDVLISGDLQFWSYAYQGSVHQDHYYVKLSPNHGASWTILLDMSSLPPFGPTGYNQWEQPYSIDLSIYAGQVVDIVWQAVDGDGLGLWYPWAIDDCSIAGKKLDPQPWSPGIWQGYNVFRKAWNTSDFAKITEQPVNDTFYVDAGLDPGLYQYFVTGASTDCSISLSSDTVSIDVITGLQAEKKGSYSVYPDPASEFIIITGSPGIKTVYFYDLQGRQIENLNFPCSEKVRISLNKIPAGIYILKILSRNAQFIAKLSVLHQ